MRRLLATLCLINGLSSTAGLAAEPQILNFSPQGIVKDIRQVRVQFSEPMVAFGDPRLADPFKITCSEAGKGFWEDERNWIYDFSKDLPAGINCQFNTQDNLKTLAGKVVAGQHSFQFSTGGPSIRWSQPYEGSRISEDQNFVFLVDAKPKSASVINRVYFIIEGIEERIPVEIVEGREREAILNSETLRWMPKDPKKNWVPIIIRAKRNFPSSSYEKSAAWGSGNRVQLVWGKGVTSESGVQTDNDQIYRFVVRPAFHAEFSCQRENAESNCIPLSAMTLRFSTYVPWSDAKKVILKSGDKTWKPDGKTSVGEATEKAMTYAVVFNGPFSPKTEFQVALPPNLKDEDGRELVNGTSFPLTVKTDDFPPLAKFPRSFGILELNANPTLPVTLRNLEPALQAKLLSINPAISQDTLNFKVLRPSKAEFKNIITWLSRVDAHVGAYDSRDASVFASADAGTDIKTFSVKKPNGPESFEVVGIPLTKPGLYVVELASPILGASILKSSGTYFIQTTALVTNLSVHFKWGRESSLAWVTSLDRGEPIGEALVALRNCKGDILASSKTDKNGIAKFSTLPSRNEIPKCEEDKKTKWSSYNSGLFAIAEKGDDFSFVHSSWTEGIEAYRFQLRTEPYTGPKIAHTVFDRTLLRAGETVHMKHVLRKHTSETMTLVPENELPKSLRLQHRGSRQNYVLPLSWDKAGTANTDWVIPKEAKLGEYTVFLEKKAPEQTQSAESSAEEGYEGEGEYYESYSSDSLTSGKFRVEEFRIPLMKANVFPPKDPVVGVSTVPVDVHVDYLSGGPASQLPVQLRYDVTKLGKKTYENFDGFQFGGGFLSENDLKREEAPKKAEVKTLPLSLDKTGSVHANLTFEKPKGSGKISLELEYSDPNGETQTVGSTIPVYEASRLAGLKLDSWMSKREKFKFSAAVVDLSGKAVPGAPVEVTLHEGKTYSHRKKIVGGFYAYEHKFELKKLGSICSGKTDEKGLLHCEASSPVAGNVFLQAETKDGSGNVTATSESLWLWDKEPWWFDVSDSDRIDLLPEKKRYEQGGTARFQVRMPFAKAQVLVTVEREGILDSFVTRVTREKPIIEVPIKKNYAPNVFVSAFVVRGRVGDIQPTAIVDLGRPAYKLGIAEILVDWKPHELQVQVLPEKSEYKIRDRAKIKIVVKNSKGNIPAQGTELAVAVVDEGLLELKANESWKLLDAMMRPRGYEVATASAQMQVVGKRHFGLKALPQGGGGGRSVARELFDTLLFWKPHVPVNASGEAFVEIPINDSLTSFRIVAIANGSADQFGTGSSSIRTYQELSIFSGIPPIAREGDKLKMEVTLRNGIKEGMEVDVLGRINGSISQLEQNRIKLNAGESKKIFWSVEIPKDRQSMTYEIEAQDKGRNISDKVKSTQAIKPVVPVQVIQATLTQLEKKYVQKVEPPKDALPGRGGIRVGVKPTLVKSLDGVKHYMGYYPYTCLEQKISKAIALEDEKAWKALMAELPSYLDDDGLAKFFPSILQGCDCLTAYLLSIAHEAGWEIPEAPRKRMIEGLQKFVEGKILRSSAIRTADLNFRKVAALEALSRFDAVSPSLLKSLSNTEHMNLWPTSAVIDLFNTLKRVKQVPNRDTQLQQTSQILRSRLNFRGTIMGFSTETLDRLWWLMVSNDLNANRFLLSILEEPEWKSDIPRLLQGTLGRQQYGHWDLTTANAWGVLAVKKFSSQFEKEPVAGKTTATVASKSKSVEWLKKPLGSVFDFPWPTEFGKTADLTAVHSGAGKPWMTLQSLAAIPLRDGFFKGYQIKKQLSPVQQKKKGKWTRGDVVRVQLTIDSQADMGWVVVNDPIPAGATILGSGLGRDSKLLTKDEKPKDWWSWPTYVERLFEAYRAYYEFVPKGEWSVEYTIRLNQSGELNLPPTRVEALYAPEAFGELPNPSVSVSE